MIGFGIPNGWEWIIILVVILLLFGHRLPTMARSLGSGITEFKKGLKDGAGGSSGDAGAGSGNNRMGGKPGDGQPPADGSATPPKV